MTPQQRHIDAARKIVNQWMEHSSLDYDDAVGEVAQALAEAENRAAWDGFECGRDYADAIECGKAVSADRMECDLDDKYGPRPTKENQA